MGDTEGRGPARPRAPDRRDAPPADPAGRGEPPRPPASATAGLRATVAGTLLAAALAPAPDARVLLIGCGELAAALGRRAPGGGVWLLDADYAALTAAAGALAAVGVTNAAVSFEPFVPPERVGTCDLVALVAPKSRDLTRRWLVEARRALKTGGRLYLAGANDAGVRGAIADAAALFGGVELLDYRQRHRVALAAAGDDPQMARAPDWARAPGIAPGTWREFTLAARGWTFALRSLPGVFAYDRLDEGTALLLDHLAVTPGESVLDVGCGYGIIGLLAARLGAGAIDLVDVDLLAVAAARENIARHGLQRARAFPSDVYGAVAGRRYDLIVSNPPFHAGKEVAYGAAHALIDRAPEHLRPGGRLVLVANAFLPYERRLRERFARVEALAATRRYQVLAAH